MKNSNFASVIALSVACLATPVLAETGPANAPDQSRDQAETGDQIIVTASRVTQAAREIGSSVSVLTAQDLKANQTGFVMQALFDVPGIYLNTDRPGDGNISSLSIRGSGNDEVLWLMDGIKLGDPSSTSTQFAPDHLTSADISRIEVMRGNQSSLYGSEAIGGVINIVTRRATKDGLEVNAEAEGGSYGTFNGGATVLGKSGPVDFRLTGTGYRQDGLSSYDPRMFNPATTNAQAEKDSYWRYGFSGRVGYEISPNVALMATGMWQDSRTDFDGSNYAFFPAVYPADSSDYVRKREYAVGAQGAYKSDDGKLKADVTVSRYRARRLYFGAFTRTTGELYEGTRDNVAANIAYGGTAPLSVTVGGNYEWQRDNQDAYGSILKARIHTASVYGEAALRPLDGLTLTGAVRYDDNSRFGGFTTWRVTGAYVAGQAKFRASYGTGAKAPGLYQLFDPVYGNPNLKAETSRGGDFGVDIAVNPVLSAQVTYFFNNKKNEIGFNYSAACFDPAQGCYVQFGRSKAQGVELGVKLAPTHWLTINQSFSLVKYKQDTSLAGNRPYIDPGYPQYVGTTSITVNPVEKASVTARARYQDRNLATYFGPTRPYAVIDLLGSYKLTDKIEIYARVSNLFDKLYYVTSGFQTLGRSAFGGVRVGF